MKSWFQRVVLRRKWLTFIVMGLSFFTFGVGSLNLFFLLQANGNLLLEHGWQAAADGGLLQLIELLFSGFAAMAAYLLFKTCEHRLVHWLGDDKDES